MKKTIISRTSGHQTFGDFKKYFVTLIEKLWQEDKLLYETLVGNEDFVTTDQSLKSLQNHISSILTVLMKKKSGRDPIGIVIEERIVLGEKIALGRLDEVDSEITKYANLYETVEKAVSQNDTVIIYDHSSITDSSYRILQKIFRRDSDTNVTELNLIDKEEVSKLNTDGYIKIEKDKTVVLTEKGRIYCSFWG